MKEVAQETNRNFVYPNGFYIPTNDTHATRWILGEDGKPTNLPEKLEHLDNVVLNHFGYYGLVRGDETNAQHSGLMFPNTTSRSHGHDNTLTLNFWSGGYEMLPDQGYPTRPANNQSFHRSPFAHNQATITPVEPVDQERYQYQSSRASVLAYDSGEANGKQVQLIEASMLLPEEMGVDMNRRLVMQIGTDETHSYTLDLQRLKGGAVHENVLRGSEDENSELITDLALPEPVAEKLRPYMIERFGANSCAGTNFYTNYVKNYRIVDTDKDITFQWRGMTEDDTFHAFIKGVPGAMVAFSEIPSLRRAKEDGSDAWDYPAPHFYQHREVTPEEVTKFAGVYEGTKSGETAFVQSVRWIDFADSPTAAAAVIDLGNKKDIVYVSEDDVVRNVEGIGFRGSIALLRMDKQTNQPEFCYLYSEGEIRYGDKVFTGNPDFSANVVSTTEQVGGGKGENTITVDRDLPAGALEGLASRMYFSNGAGIAHEIIGQAADGRTLYIHNPAGVKIVEDGAQMTFVPNSYNVTKQSLNYWGADVYIPYVIPGEVQLVISTPKIGQMEPAAAGDITLQTAEGAPAAVIEKGKTYRIAFQSPDLDNRLYIAAVTTGGERMESAAALQQGGNALEVSIPAEGESTLQVFVWDKKTLQPYDIRQYATG